MPHWNRAVPRYFFHVLNGEASIEETGTELPDLDAAQRKAVQTAREIIEAGEISKSDWLMMVVDDRGVIVMRLSITAEGNLRVIE